MSVFSKYDIIFTYSFGISQHAMDLVEGSTQALIYTITNLTQQINTTANDDNKVRLVSDCISVFDDGDMTFTS